MRDTGVFHSAMRKLISTVFTQGIILILSLVAGFILPKYMGTRSYGLWQTYLFYLGYLNIFGLGYNDGIALYYGGLEYEALPFQRFRGAFVNFLIYLTIIVGILIFATFFISDIEMRKIYTLLIFNIPATCIQCIVLTTFLSVNKITEYNIVNLAIKLFTVLSYLILIALDITGSVYLMYTDTAIRLLISFGCVFLGRRFLFGRPLNLREGAKELKQKSKAGFHITVALIASMFIPVAGRVVIEYNESKEVYGIYSFAMLLLSLIIMFTNTAGTVIFPTLRRLKEDSLAFYYKGLVILSDGLIYIAFLLYVPMVVIINNWLKDYRPALEYLHILLAMCVPLGRFQLLISPYYKTLRMEKSFLIVNLSGAAVMMAGTFYIYIIFHSVVAVATVTTLILTVWCLVTESYLTKKMEYKIPARKIFVDFVMMGAFIVACSFQNALFFLLIYGTCLFIYFLFYRKEYQEIKSIFVSK